jgi:hypothetical protein
LVQTGLVAAFGIGAVAGSGLPASAAGGPSCGMQTFKSPEGVVIRALFAKNGSVQRYEIVSSQANMESVNDMRLSLERQYGPEAVDAPPLRITSFKKSGGGGLMVPDKAVDSCGRTLSFN